ncbi:cysteine desulfurase [Corynebacterium sp. CCM 8835]|uniref:cysteine desulfurase family protein n=1 Tax=Corynebacterium antarcticum TaxID=2800405 RepID=UPI00200627D6|nr:cysteine desulfurase family protein [Corynebacterium antarcticum]MCK7641360.1 cysteine desulfurase [Corynebacterium antarcticum]MCL0244591.1 cysteine desulfurase [Corynebacterium antarcticum]MCX7539852.1 cysteine desulfurase family protein [Corynebacterium antarcticum]
MSGPDLIYLDHAATTPPRPEVLRAMWPFLTTEFGNPSSHHGVGEAARAGITAARRAIADTLGVRPDELVFTSGGTEADNLAVKGITLGHRRRTGRAHLLTGPLEHSAVRESAAYLRRFHDVPTTELTCDGSGLVDPDTVEALIRPDTFLVSVQAANNEVGTVQDLGALSAVCRKHGVPLHTDAVQAAGQLEIRPSVLGVDSLSLSGHKLGTPRGIGLVWARSSVPVEPLIHGGGQQRGRRSGSEDVAGAVALATALVSAESERAATAERMTRLRDGFIGRVLATVPGARLTGHPTRRLPGNASFVIDAVNGETVLIELERRGVICSSGSACAAGSQDPSPVLLAMGIGEDLARTALRFSLGRATTEADLAAAAGELAAVVAALRHGS